MDKVNFRGTWDEYETWGKAAKQATVRVKSYPSNAWGLYDKLGNVWEWCEDVWQEQLGTKAVTDSWLVDGKRLAEAEVCARRVVRGGSWSFDGRG